MDKIELLAPAGTMESLYAAVSAGADAVYIGGSKFSARAYAGNFDEEEIKNAVNYCHMYGVKLYVTMNILVKENEISEALEYARTLYNIGIDALIIQDVGLAYRINQEMPDFELHASTQMTIHNGEGAKFLKDCGFKRIVLSRELSLDEIKYISKDLNIETEIFIHGALCVCYSGQCLMSSIIGGRSGNRGRCAQPCRLPYTLYNSKSGEEKSGYILSPKDICTIDDIRDIIESGTSSLKIEGRMKKPEYVAGVVRSYRKAIDSYFNGKNEDLKKERKQLLQLFNREGFSKAYFRGNVGREMMAYNFPKNTGIVLGSVDKNSNILLEEDISLGDGIRVKEDGFTVTSIIKNGNNVTKAFKGDKVQIKPIKYKYKDVLYKTSDEELNRELSEYYKNPYSRKIILPLNVHFKVGEGIKISTSYNGKIFEAVGEEVQKALKKPLDKEKLSENLMKSGDNAFRFNNIEFLIYEEGFLPLAAINKIRRELIENLQDYIVNNKIKNKAFSFVLPEKSSKELDEVFAYINTEDQLKACIECDIKNIMVNPFMKNFNIEFHKLREQNVYLKVPNIIKGDFSKAAEFINEELSHIKGIVTANLGIISEFKDVTEIIGDYKLNLFNSYSGEFYRHFIDGSCLSIELNKKELKELTKHMNLPCQQLIYGKIEIMVSEYCAIGSTFGGKCSTKGCNGSCTKGVFLLRDRKNEEFLLKTDKFCRSYIYNNVPLNLIPYKEELQRIGINSYRFDFIDESYEDTLKVLKSYKEGESLKDYSNYTRGHYKRGVE